VLITVKNFARFINSCRTLGLQDTEIKREIQKLLFSRLPSNAPIFSDPRFTIFSSEPSFTGDDNSLIYETINPPPALLNPQAFADPSETGILNIIFGESSPLTQLQLIWTIVIVFLRHLFSLTHFHLTTLCHHF